MSGHLDPSEGEAPCQSDAGAFGARSGAITRPKLKRAAQGTGATEATGPATMPSPKLKRATQDTGAAPGATEATGPATMPSPKLKRATQGTGAAPGATEATGPAPHCTTAKANHTAAPSADPAARGAHQAGPDSPEVPVARGVRLGGPPTVPCWDCFDEGDIPPKFDPASCPTCKGSGEIQSVSAKIAEEMNTKPSQEVLCDTCDGDGCGDCNGFGVVRPQGAR